MTAAPRPSPRPSRRLSAWLGLALAACFFYPLAAVIEAEPFYLHWQPAHVWEAAAALLGLAVVLGLLVHATWTRPGRAATLALALGAAVPLLSLGTGIARQVTFDEPLWRLWERPFVPHLAAAAALGLFVLGPAVSGRVLRGTLVVLSPIALVVIGTLGMSLRAVQVIAIDREPAPATAACPSVLALLFDELSFDYLYDGAEIRADFPQLKQFAAAATNHLRVRSPGERTLLSVPGYLAARTFDDMYILADHLDYQSGSERAPLSAVTPDGLFGTARRAGFSAEVGGFYFPYCEMLGLLLDACRSFSFYNVAAAGSGFSPVHALMTTAILWPSEFPHSLLKGPAIARLQRARVERTVEFAARPIGSRPIFRYIHFSVPHLPYVFDADGYNPPFDPTRPTSDRPYVAQMRYTDRLFGELLEQLRQSGALARTTVAVFADHGFRSGVSQRERDVRHVPFIVKDAGQTARVDVDVEERGELLLRSLVEGCGA